MSKAMPGLLGRQARSFGSMKLECRRLGSIMVAVPQAELKSKIQRQKLSNSPLVIYIHIVN
jgi:hypothetical protein